MGCIAENVHVSRTCGNQSRPPSTTHECHTCDKLFNLSGRDNILIELFAVYSSKGIRSRAGRKKRLTYQIAGRSAREDNAGQIAAVGTCTCLAARHLSTKCVNFDRCLVVPRGAPNRLDISDAYTRHLRCYNNTTRAKLAADEYRKGIVSDMTIRDANKF